MENSGCNNTWGDGSPCPYHSMTATMVQILHILSPIFVTSFFLIASTILFFNPTDRASQPPKKASRKPLELGLTGVIGLLYIVEACSIIAYPRHGLLQPPTGSHKTSLDLELVFALYSTLAWLVLFLGSVSYGEGVKEYNFWGAWLVAFCMESLLFAFITADSGHLDRKTITLQAIIQSLQLLSTGGLIAENLWQNQEQASDEEVTPLLLSLEVEDQHSNQTAASRDNYRTGRVEGQSQSEETTAVSCENGSKTSNESTAKGADEEDDEDEDEEFKDAAKKVGQNWWQYVKTFKVFLPYMWPGQSLRLQLNMIGVAVCILSQRVLNVLVPISFGKVVTSLSEGSVPWMALSSYIVLGLFNSPSGLQMWQRFLWYSIQRDSMFRLKTATYDHLMNLSCDFHSMKKSGRIWQLTQRGYQVVMLFKTIVTELLPTTADLVIAVSVFFIMFDAYVGFIIGVTSVLYWYFTMAATAKSVEFQRLFSKNWEKEYYQMTESTQNWSTVSYFNRHPHEKERYRSHVKSTQLTMYRRWSFQNMISVVKQITLKTGLLAASILVCVQIARNQREIGQFAFLIVYWDQLTGPLEYFATGFKDIAEQLIDAEKLLALLQKVPSVRDDEDAPDFIMREGAVKFEAVSFSYDGKRQVSNNISFEVRPGETVALVGETGSGKSTLIKLLFRFYDPTEGRILVDGQDIRRVALSSYRHYVGVVPQEVILFNESVHTNLRYGNLEATDEQIQAACKMVNLHDRIMSFTKGYNELVGERGTKLSGGELQRVAIARAMLKNPRILLLDEATSNVDTKTECHIQKGLTELRENRTTFVIAHRLSTIINAHKILVIMDGKVVESGSHAELMKHKGPYQELWASQRLAFLGNESSEAKSKSRSRSTSKNRPALVNDLTDSAEGISLIQQIDGEHGPGKKNAKPKSKFKTRNSTSPHGHEHKGHTTSHDSDQDRGRSPTKSILQGLRRQLSDSVSVKRAGLSTSAPSSSASTQTVLKPDAPEFVPKSYKYSILSASISPTRSNDELIKKAPKASTEPNRKSTAADNAIEPERKADALAPEMQVPGQSSSVAALEPILEDRRKSRFQSLSKSPKRKSRGKSPAKFGGTQDPVTPGKNEGETAQVEGFQAPEFEVEVFRIERNESEQQEVEEPHVETIPVEAPKPRFHLSHFMRRKKSASEPVIQFDGGDSDDDYCYDNAKDAPKPDESGSGSGNQSIPDVETASIVRPRATTSETPTQSIEQNVQAKPGLAATESSQTIKRPLRPQSRHIAGASLGSDDTEIARGPKVCAPANTPASPASPAGGDEGERGLFENFEYEPMD